MTTLCVFRFLDGSFMISMGWVESLGSMGLFSNTLHSVTLHYLMLFSCRQKAKMLQRFQVFTLLSSWVSDQTAGAVKQAWAGAEPVPGRSPHQFPSGMTGRSEVSCSVEAEGLAGNVLLWRDARQTFICVHKRFGEVVVSQPPATSWNDWRGNSLFLSDNVVS